jgi:hypothetical protein
MAALYAEALAGAEHELLAKTVAGLVHPATLQALKSAGMTVAEAATVVGDFLAHQARG